MSRPRFAARLTGLEVSMLKPIAVLLAVAVSAVACGTTGEVPPQTPAGSSTAKPGDPSQPEGPTPDGTDPAAPVDPLPLPE